MKPLAVVRHDGCRVADGIVESLALGLEELDYKVHVGMRGPESACALLLVPRPHIYLSVPPGAVLYSVEQPDAFLDADIRAAKGCKPRAVWTFARSHVPLWKAHGFDAHYVPIGWHPKQARFELEAERPTDVLFYGNLTPRRMAVIKRLRTAGLKVDAVQDAWGDDLAKLVARAKVVLTLRRDEQCNVLETARVLPLIASGACVVAEDGEESESFVGAVRLAPYEMLPSVCEALARDLVERARLGEMGPRIVRRWDVTALLRVALASPPRFIG